MRPKQSPKPADFTLTRSHGSLAGARRRLMPPVLGALLSILLLGCPPTAEERPEAAAPAEPLIAIAPVECPPETEVTGHDLTEPRVIRAVGQLDQVSLVNSKLVVRKVTHKCVPLFKPLLGENGTWVWEEMELRTYGAPKEGNNPKDPDLEFSIPGPTYRVRKARLETDQKKPGENNLEVVAGTRFKLLLANELPNNSYPYDECEVATYVGCVDQEGNPILDPTTGDPTLCTRSSVDVEYTCPAPTVGECKEFEIEQTAPECFHGADVTNLHYHGTHVSPQPHQDYVLLKLFSANQTDPPPPCGPATSKPCDPDGAYAVGKYQTDINPLPWNQPPGTHWYHPHNHGSTALQVLNGLAGTLIIEGEFDEWLNNFYGVDSPERLAEFERLLVVGQNWPDVVFFEDRPGRRAIGYPPYPLVNGQAIPKTKMKYGEVQRWRFVGATVQSSAQLALQFPDGFEVLQIAQDGVQFSPDNYDEQPLRVEIVENGKTVTKYLLAPGNRLDFLVKAPEAEAGVPARTFRMTQRTFGNLQDEVKEQLEERRVKLQAQFQKDQPRGLERGQTFDEALFTIEVSGIQSMPLPTTDPNQPPERRYPRMPYYLRDIDESKSVGSTDLLFSMTDPAGKASTPGSPFNGFWINGRQYSPGCADVSMNVGTVETWNLSNDSSPNHPFHIHINPFQVTDVKGIYGVLSNTPMDVKYKHPVWQDTIALPGPVKDKDGNVLYNGAVKILQRFEDYSGAFVLHCHFLGHEDRGMMFNVQTKCLEEEYFGTPTPGGRGDDCTVPASTKPNPFPECKPYG